MEGASNQILVGPDGTQMQEELQTSVVCNCCCFLAGYLALAGLNLLAQLSNRIHHFTALNSVHVRKLGQKGQWHLVMNRKMIYPVR